MALPYPLVTFGSRYLPYCIDSLPNSGGYAVLNREYSPLGWTLDMHFKYTDFSVTSNIRGLTPEVASRISARGSCQTDRVYLYNDGCVPMRQPRHWRDYMRRLRVLAGLPVSGTTADHPSFLSRYLPHALVRLPSGEFRVVNCAGRPLGFPVDGEDVLSYYVAPTTSRIHGLTNHQILRIALPSLQHHLLLPTDVASPASSDVLWAGYSERLRRLARLGVAR